MRCIGVEIINFENININHGWHGKDEVWAIAQVSMLSCSFFQLSELWKPKHLNQESFS